MLIAHAHKPAAAADCNKKINDEDAATRGLFICHALASDDANFFFSNFLRRSHPAYS